MSELVVLGLKVGFLALLWLFILFTGNVIRTDLFGRKVSAAELARAQAAPTQGAAAAKPPKVSRRTLKQLPKTLTVTHGKQAGLQLPLGEAVLIGRASDCQLILDDDYVSTRHARISRTPAGFQVEDLGSTNGTFVNNQRISAPTPFGVDDTLRIGRTLMGVER
ncbi:MAG: FHA domain-containing protein [Propionicimonas sp.]|uniref:FHA domain-containing protein FhaB/FipA n=1 Tax=Propionicimonas sp. TaxID=1955623 RepID=UPI003D099C8A